MRRISALLLGIALGGALVYGSFNYHVVRAKDGFLMVPRVEVALDDTYVDIRQWTFQDWRKHPRLTRDMLKAGHGERVKTAIQDGLVEDVLHGLGVSSAPKESSRQ